MTMFDAEALIQYGGLAIVLLTIYAQTGLFFCFFIPSGAFLFTAGVWIASGQFAHSFFTLCSLGVIACVLGNITGYIIGYKAGPLLYRRSDSGFFKKQYLTAASDFYNKYGALALSIGVFLPLTRTFGPIVAGIIRLKFSRLVLFSSLGSVGWIVSFAFAGYLIGSMPFLRPYLNYLVVAIIVLVTIPVATKIIQGFRKKSS